MMLRERIDADQRLVMVRLLAEAPGYTLGESMLDEVLEAYGHRVSRDKVRAHLAWLDEQGLEQVLRRQLGMARGPRALVGGLQGFLALEGQAIEAHGGSQKKGRP